MELSQRLKYLRKKRGITQADLAELSEIHHVSIRKYETNKNQPQPAQLRKLAEALNVSTLALNNFDDIGLRMDTQGDLMGLLIYLYELGIIQAKGTRGSDGAIDKDTFHLIFSPVLAPFFELQSKDGRVSLNDVLINIKDSEVFEDFILWDKLSYNKTMAVLSTNTLNDIFNIDLFVEQKNAVELELQSKDKSIF